MLIDSINFSGEFAVSTVNFYQEFLVISCLDLLLSLFRAAKHLAAVNRPKKTLVIVDQVAVLYVHNIIHFS